MCMDTQIGSSAYKSRTVAELCRRRNIGQNLEYFDRGLIGSHSLCRDTVTTNLRYSMSVRGSYEDRQWL